MEIVDSIAMTNAMATGVVDFGAGPALWLTLLGLLVGTGAGILFSKARPWRASMSRMPRLRHVAPPAARLAGAAK